MSSAIKYLFFFLISFSYAQLPEGFVYVKQVVPDLDVDLRYYSNNNFIGKPVKGYETDKLILTVEAANALKKIQKELQDMNLCLLVFDGYRPQQAVNHFIDWAKDLNDTVNKHAFYPNVDKRNLFKEEYIATRSGHSKGSTVDLTIIDGNTGEPLDMGSSFDFFGEVSWVNYNNITEKQKANRMLLQQVMLKYGFRNYPKEWWHFTLRNEPFPKTYFDFPVQ
ncbi:M15 family metallopeptidase [Aestuariibaculum sediminum]|uniref:D-alanyl-D-alanine dipeptidase n=1 Tax=Aestuariibaculum sediminum TaxID=2770637 RepID=A0A8J6Q8U5_9FLAO|nr:M15 family metallopeptidase [Aestuariibaculum sediminum]MBD0833045.1 M15 family metallopeptidase [Aestuariibaculum sediminum]